MRRLALVAAVAVMATVLPGCKTTVDPFVVIDGYAGCALSGVETNVEHQGDVAGLGAVEVRVRDCDGAAVNAKMDLNVELWVIFFPPGSLAIRCGESPNFHTDSADVLASPVDLSPMLDPACDNATATHWFTRTFATVWIFGSPYYSGAVDSPIEVWNA